MIDAVQDRSLKVRPWMYRLFVPVNIILAALVLVAAVLPETSTLISANNAVSVTADIGSLLLLGTLVPSNLLRFKRLKQWRALKILARFRAPVGISSGVWFVAHTILSLRLFDLATPLLPQFATADIVIGALAIVVFVAMLATSNEASQRLLGKNWKRLQLLVWFALPLALAHTVLSSLRFLKDAESLGLIVLGGLLGFVAFEGLASWWRGGAARRKASTHVSLAAAGVLVAALLYVFLP
jgi:DMSO/TMAO reductase YedYZ heme-binding membrane subunit